MADGVKLPLKSLVRILDGPVGQVVGRAEHLHREDEYLVRYLADESRRADPQERWWGESALQPQNSERG